MLKGTLPCIFLIVPCVLSGSFLLKDHDESGPWSAVSGATIFIASLFQGTSMLAAFFYITETSQSCHAELKKPRPEHEAVQAFEIMQQRRNALYYELTEWANL